MDKEKHIIMEDRLNNIEKLVTETRSEVKNLTQAMTTLVLQEHRLKAVETDIEGIKANKRELWKEVHSIKEECIARKAVKMGAETAPQTTQEVWDSIVAGAATHGMWIVIATAIGLLMARFIK